MSALKIQNELNDCKGQIEDRGSQNKTPVSSVTIEFEDENVVHRGGKTCWPKLFAHISAEGKQKKGSQASPFDSIRDTIHRVYHHLQGSSSP